MPEPVERAMAGEHERRVVLEDDVVCLFSLPELAAVWRRAGGVVGHAHVPSLSSKACVVCEKVCAVCGGRGCPEDEIRKAKHSIGGKGQN